jgi:hypothetical protein
LVTTYSPVDDGAGAAAQADEDEMSEFDADDEMARASDRDGVGYDAFLSERAVFIAFIVTGRFVPPREAKPVMIPSGLFARMFATLAAPRIFSWYLVCFSRMSKRTVYIRCFCRDWN